MKILHRHFKAYVVAFILILAFPVQVLAEEPRYALLIGNAEYGAGNKLENPVNDVKSMKDVLAQCGFQVTNIENADKKTIMDAIRSFSSGVSKGSTVLFYYSGHGIQYKGENYLVPINNNIQKEHDIEIECVNVNWTLNEIMSGGAGIKLIILDACRNNPFAKSFSRSLSNTKANSPMATGTAMASKATRMATYMKASGPTMSETVRANTRRKTALFTRVSLKTINSWKRPVKSRNKSRPGNL